MAKSRELEYTFDEFEFKDRFFEVTVIIKVTCNPEEKRTHWYPGCAASVDFECLKSIKTVQDLDSDEDYNIEALGPDFKKAVEVACKKIPQDWLNERIAEEDDYEPDYDDIGD